MSSTELREVPGPSVQCEYVTCIGGRSSSRQLPSIINYRKRPVNITAQKPVCESYAMSVCRFLVKNGIPLDSVEDQSFKNLSQHLNYCVLPVNAETLERQLQLMKVKPSQHFKEVEGPFCTTVDVLEYNFELYIAFSIHYFDINFCRKNVTFLKKFEISEIDGRTIMPAIRQTINSSIFTKGKRTSLVSTSEEIMEKMSETGVIAEKYICFFTYLTRFIEDVSRIETFRSGLQEISNFVYSIRGNAGLYARYRRIQLFNNGELDLPSLKDSGWVSTTLFLTKCLSLKNVILHENWHLKTGLTHEVFENLSYLQKLMAHVQQLAHEVSSSQSTASSVIPAVSSIKTFIETTSTKFENDVLDVFTKHLQPLKSGFNGNRYDYACLLDPRYAYRDYIYTPEQWKNIERNLQKDVYDDKIVFNGRMVSEEAVRNYRPNTIQDELNYYRTILGTHRPGPDDDLFVWWSGFQCQFKLISQTVKDVLVAPAVTIDANEFFGKAGKFTRMCSKMSYQQIKKALEIVSGEGEEFKGRGFAPDVTSYTKMFESNQKNENKPPEYKQLTNLVQNGNSTEDEALIREKRPRRTLSYFKLGDEIEVLHDGYSESMMMMEPPEEKRDLGKKHEFERPCCYWNSEPCGSGINASEEVAETTVEDTFDSRNEESTESTTIENSTVHDDYLKDILMMKPSEEEPKNQKIVNGENEKTGRKDDVAFEKNTKMYHAQRTFCEVCLEPVRVEPVRRSSPKITLFLAGMVLANKTTIEKAKSILERTSHRSYFCRVHFHEACVFVLRELNIKKAEDIGLARSDRLNNLLQVCESIRGSELNSRQFNSSFASLMKKNFEPKEFEEPVEKSPGITLDTLFMASSANNNNQTETTDNRDDKHSVTTDKDFTNQRIPIKPRGAKKCAYCDLPYATGFTVRIPTHTTQVRSKWYEILGEKFKNYVESVEDSYICRSHFEPDAFSLSGKLLKRKVPVAIEILKKEEMCDNEIQSKSPANLVEPKHENFDSDIEIIETD